MKKAKNILACLALAAAAFALVAIGILAVQTNRSVRRADLLVAQVSDAVAAATKMEATAASSQRDVQAQTLMALHNARQTLAHLNDTVLAVNRDVIPNLTTKMGKTLDSSQKLMADADEAFGVVAQQTGDSLSDVDKELVPFMQAATKTVTDSDKLLADPVMLKNLADASAELPSMMRHADAILDNGEKSSGYLTQYVYRLTRPARAIVAFAKAAAYYAALAGGAAAGVMH